MSNRVTLYGTSWCAFSQDAFRSAARHDHVDVVLCDDTDRCPAITSYPSFARDGRVCAVGYDAATDPDLRGTLRRCARHS